MSQLHFSEAIPLSLYIHLPWCLKKCPYCDFNSHAQKEEGLPEERYVDALLKDLELSVPLVWGRTVSSIFIGGGTPSLFSAESIATLLSGIRSLIKLSPNAEITLEANPGTFESEKFAGFAAAGINRLSIGVQSLDDQQLQQLGRVHDAQQALTAYETARSAGFTNINLDMMYALPKQTQAEAEQDLEQLIALQPEHISYYQLTLEPNTLFHKYPPVLPEHELSAQMSDTGQELLASAGYHQYEVSAYALNDKQCRHNNNYWEFGDYLGIGAGAHGKLTQPALQQITRTTKPRQPEQYMQFMEAGNLETPQVVPEQDLAFEFFLNGLRLNDGVTTSLFEQRTGLGLESVAEILGKLRDRGLLNDDPSQIQTSETGRRFIDEMTPEFLNT